MQPQYWADPVYYRCEPGQRFNENLVRLHDFTLKVIRERKAELLNQTSTIKFKPNGKSEIENADGEKRKAFLDLLLDHHIKTGELTEEDIREEVDTFMFEGKLENCRIYRLNCFFH